MEGDLTVDNLEKRKEYKEISTLFSQWKQWQRQFFLCDFTSIVPMNILGQCLTYDWNLRTYSKCENNRKINKIDETIEILLKISSHYFRDIFDGL